MPGMILDKCESISQHHLAVIQLQILPEYSHLFQTGMSLGGSVFEPQTAISVSPLGQGLINSTYLLSCPSGKFVLQQINCHVFPAPWTLVNNSALISHHLHQQAIVGRYQLAVIEPLLTNSGALALDLGADGFWRLLSYVPKSITLSQVDNASMAQQVGATFGHFAANITGINPSSIGVVIDDFLNLPKRLTQLQQAAQQDQYNRLSGCKAWVELALAQHDLMAQLASVEAMLPRRICHNDTKINNMLFSQVTLKPLAVIDLDTCMPGYLMYDFGDMVRAFCSPVAEDSTELANIHARPELILAAAKGYIDALKGIMSDEEVLSLWLGVKLMTLMLASRFLSDHLQGDAYFAVGHPNHNLQRAINQFTLFLSLQTQDAAMEQAFTQMSQS
ncbi:phosphotransferase enzyme family protein [Shewanella sp. SR44-3]|uniref:phosphotransferase enzyme family protein n=1 Tax=Shewanella sp. SR44-3 TaxID=2760936 RepID=UPI0015FAD564|nr:aminoglycoside phosphotransferase family protein [Shewanella sp. SR44-3]MBB1270484.1 aminoglycoside phosphotransferase family protein [Shewanella sp. SR44-3]